MSASSRCLPLLFPLFLSFPDTCHERSLPLDSSENDLASSPPRQFFSSETFLPSAIFFPPPSLKAKRLWIFSFYFLFCFFNSSDLSFNLLTSSFILLPVNFTLWNVDQFCKLHCSSLWQLSYARWKRTISISKMKNIYFHCAHPAWFVNPHHQGHSSILQQLLIFLVSFLAESFRQASI